MGSSQISQPKSLNLWAVIFVILMVIAGGVALNTLYDDVQWMLEGEPTAIGCEDLLAGRATARWVRVSGCAVDLSRGVAESQRAGEEGVVYVPLRAATEPDGTIIRALITYKQADFGPHAATLGTPREPSEWEAVLRPPGDLESGRLHRLYARNEIADSIHVLDANPKPWTFVQLSKIAFGVMAAFFVVLGIRKHFQFARAREAARRARES